MVVHVNNVSWVNERLLAVEPPLCVDQALRREYQTVGADPALTGQLCNLNQELVLVEREPSGESGPGESNGKRARVRHAFERAASGFAHLPQRPVLVGSIQPKKIT